MARDVAVLDANVLIPAAPRDTLLRAARRFLYRPVWSEAILQEVERNLVENRLTTGAGARRLVTRLRTAFPGATAADHAHLVELMPNHPHDRHVMAAAVVESATFIVTSNLRHFHQAALQPFAINALSPDQFLTRLFDNDPIEMVDIIVEQSAALKRPVQTPQDVLRSLATHAPVFATLVSEKLRE